MRLMILWLGVSLSVPGSVWAGEKAISFNRDVLPILANHCFACHGPDAEQRQADLRLDLEAAAKADRDGSFVIHGTRPSDSLLLTRIQEEDAELQMPPPQFQKPLTDQQKATLRQWIKEGANWDSHWAFKTLRKPDVPKITEGQLSNDIDRFLVAQLMQSGIEITQSEAADKVTLIRRLSFDLRGIPPTLEEVTAFVSQGQSYESMIEAFLASSSYGERMAQYWLDLVRYADSGGYHSDVTVHISPYRDYVIQSFNSNMPFDQFTIEQLAGDLLDEPTQWQIIATGYNRLNKTTEEGGAQPGEYIVKYAADRIRTTSGAWLGITLGCAECHDHKYDPFTARDFYSFGAFFADIQEVGQYTGGRREPEIHVPTLPQRAELARLDAELKQATESGEAGKIESLTKAKAEIEKQFVRTMITKSVAPKEIRILPRGDWLNKTGAVVTPAYPTALSHLGSPSQESMDRLDR